MPVHIHTMSAATQDPADAKNLNPGNSSFARSVNGTIYQAASNTTLAPQAATPTGGDSPHNNMMPFLTLNFNIALQGVFPQRP
jgi:microcystin-dependent protein